MAPIRARTGIIRDGETGSVVPTRDHAAAEIVPNFPARWIS